MFNQIKQNYYTYNPSEFVPIFRNGKLQNRRQFFFYKAKHTAKLAAQTYEHLIDRAYQG